MTLLLIFLTMQLSTVEGYHQDYAMAELTTKYFEQTYFIDAGINITTENNFLFLKANARIPVYMSMEEVEFFPLNLSSYIEAGINWGPLTIGIKHICIHPLAPNVDSDTDVDFHDSWYDEIYINVKSGALKIQL